MISRLGLAISRVFHRVCPDPFVIAILLTALTAILALAFGRFPAEANSIPRRAEALFNAWRADDGIWKLLAFGMQMCLILVTGHALGSRRTFRRIINALADRTQSAGGSAVLVCIASCVTGLINWGLGLIVGALMAPEVGRSCARRGVRVHYPLLAAAGYMGLLVFHGGVSGSAPIATTTLAGAKKVLPESALVYIGEGIPLDRTLFSPLNLLVTGGLVMLLPVLFWLLAPKRAEDMQPMVIDAAGAARTPQPIPPAPPTTQGPVVLPGQRDDGDISIPDRLDRSPIVACILAVLLLAAFIMYVRDSGALRIRIDDVNALMFALGLILHGSPRAYMSAVEDAARDCGGIIIQFPIYAGIMAMMKASGMIDMLTDAFTRIGTAQTLPVMSFLAATLVGLFVPSGGAQWSLQGPIALQSGAAVGADPGAMLMSVAYGDELANMLQPFWALPLLAITGVRARDIVGYTAIAMLVAGAWMAVGLLVA